MPIDRLSGEPSGTPRQLPFPRTGRNLWPAWSPDGKYLAFVSGSPADPYRWSVVLVPNGGGAPLEFPIQKSHYSGEWAPYDLRWFGNSTGLGFSGVDTRGEGVLFHLTPATGEWKRFVLDEKRTWIEWDAHGSRYYYARQGEIVELDLQSSAVRIVFKGTAANETFRHLQFGPDRRSLVFTSITDARQELVVVDIETGQSRVLLDEAAGMSLETAIFLGRPTWSPDGRAILITRTEKQVTDLRLIPVAGGEVRHIALGAELTRLSSSISGLPALGSISWSPDGGVLAFGLSSPGHDTWLLENPLAVASAAAGARK